MSLSVKETLGQSFWKNTMLHCWVLWFTGLISVFPGSNTFSLTQYWNLLHFNNITVRIKESASTYQILSDWWGGSWDTCSVLQDVTLRKLKPVPIKMPDWMSRSYTNGTFQGSIFKFSVPQRAYGVAVLHFKTPRSAYLICMRLYLNSLCHKNTARDNQGSANHEDLRSHWCLNTFTEIFSQSLTAVIL